MSQNLDPVVVQAQEAITKFDLIVQKLNDDLHESQRQLREFNSLPMMLSLQSYTNFLSKHQATYEYVTELSVNSNKFMTSINSVMPQIERLVSEERYKIMSSEAWKNGKDSDFRKVLVESELHKTTTYMFYLRFKAHYKAAESVLSSSDSILSALRNVHRSAATLINISILELKLNVNPIKVGFER